MLVKQGIPVSPGIAIGKAAVLGHDELRPPRRMINRSEAELELRRFDRAVVQATREIEEEISRLDQEFQLPHQVLESHRDMIRDPALRGQVEKIVRTEHINVESALAQVLEGYYRRFEEMQSAYIAERAQDIREIERKLLRVLLGKRSREVRRIPPDSVIVAHNLTPAEAAGLKADKVLGFALDGGGRTSHT